MLWEAMTASPVDARVSPVSIRKVVVLPAPFTPSRPKHCGGEKWRNRKEGGGGEEEMKGEGWRERRKKMTTVCISQEIVMVEEVM